MSDEQAGSKQERVSPLTGYPPPPQGKWKPGQTGNPEGGRLHKRYKLAIEIAMARLAPSGDPMETAIRMAAAQIARAEQGDTGAFRELADRIDGKVPTSIGGTDELPGIKGFAWLDPTKTASSE